MVADPGGMEGKMADFRPKPQWGIGGGEMVDTKYRPKMARKHLNGSF